MNITDMKVEEVADLINTALQENKGISVNKICDTLKIKRSTLKSRLTRGGYSFNAEKNLYEHIDTKHEDYSNTEKYNGRNTKEDIKSHTSKDRESNAEFIKDSNDDKNTKQLVVDNTKVIKEYELKDNTKRTLEKTTEQVINNKNGKKITLEELEKRVIELEKVVSVLEGKKKKINNRVAVVNTADTTTKSIRLYTEVKEELDKYIEEHKKIKVIDIISNAIMEYIKRH